MVFSIEHISEERSDTVCVSKNRECYLGVSSVEISVGNFLRSSIVKLL